MYTELAKVAKTFCDIRAIIVLYRFSFLEWRLVYARAL